MTPRELADMVAEELRDTAGFLSGVLIRHAIEEMQHNTEFCDRLDELVFECDGCGWWTGVEELNDDTGDRLCNDCAEDRDGD
jgi:hypothetical protein